MDILIKSRNGVLYRLLPKSEFESAQAAQTSLSASSNTYSAGASLAPTSVPQTSFAKSALNAASRSASGSGSGAWPRPLSASSAGTAMTNGPAEVPVNAKEVSAILQGASAASPGNWLALWQKVKPVNGQAHTDVSTILQVIESMLVDGDWVLISADEQAKRGARPKGVSASAGGGTGSGSSGKPEPANLGPAAGDKPSHTQAPNTPAAHDTVQSADPSSGGQATKDTCAEGDPVSMITGEEMVQHHDATLPGPMPFVFKRTYRSSQTADMGLGCGWTYSGLDVLELEPDALYYVDDEGRKIRFALPKVDQTSQYLPEGLSLHRVSENAFVLKKEGEWDKVFSRSNARSPRILLTQLRHPYYRPETSAKAASGFCIFLRHDAKQKLVRVEGNWGKSFRLDWQGVHLQRIRLCNDISKAEKVVAEYQVDDHQNLIAHKNANGVGEQYAYQNHLLVKRTLASGFNFYFEWDGSDHTAKCIHNWGDRGIYEYRFEWDPANQQSKATDSRGYQRQYRYNAYGQITAEIDNEGGLHQKTYHLGRLTSYTDPLGSTTTYLYDKDNRAIGYLDEKQIGACQSYFKGKLTGFTDRDGASWRRHYNSKGQLVRIIGPEGDSQSFTYNDQGLITQSTHHKSSPKNDSSTRYSWNAQGECIAITDPRGHQRRFEYDDWGQVVAMDFYIQGDRPSQQKASNPYAKAGAYTKAGSTRYQYNPTGQVTKVTAANGDVTSYTYNDYGQLIQHSDPQGRITQFKYDGLSQVIERIDPEGQRLQYEYDTERNLTALINENGDRYQFEYDGNERLIKEVGFDGSVQEYAYNAAGHLIEHIDAGEVRTLFERDTQGRMVTKTCIALTDPEQPNETVRFAYDAKGRLIESYNQDHYLALEYNAYGQLLAEQHCDIKNHKRMLATEQNIHYHRHSPAELKGLTLPDGQTLEYNYDRYSQLTGIALNSQSIAQLARDDFGREIQRTQGDLITQLSYDPMGRLQKQHSFNSDNKAPGPVQRSYEYNEHGNLSRLTDGNQDTRYLYDFVNRLTKVEGTHTDTFSFDPASNLLSMEGQNKNANKSKLAEGNRLAMQGDRKFQYDKRGNLIQENRGKDGKLETHYEYNLQNQLVKVDKQGQVTEYKYDPLGRRIEKRDTFGTSKYVWAGDQLVQEHRKGLKKTYLYEPNSFKPVAMVQDDKVYHYHTDHLGTPKELTDQQGKVVWRAKYQTYGNVALEIEEVENPIRFQGQYFDEESGLHYNRHRYYDPSVGQFTQQDPIGLLGGVNNYQYAPNPISWVDPLGLKCKESKPYKNNQNALITDPAKLIAAPKWDTPEHPDFPIETFVTTEDMYFEQAIDGSYQLDKISGKVKPGGFFTTANSIRDERFMREDLAVTHKMKPDVTHVAVFKFPAGVTLQKSTVNPQTDLDGAYLPGGAPQVEILNYEDRSKLELSSLRDIKK